MKSGRFLVAFESLATVVVLVVWVAVVVAVEGAFSAGVSVPRAAGDAGLPRAVDAAASGPAAGPSRIEPAPDPGRDGG